MTKQSSEQLCSALCATIDRALGPLIRPGPAVLLDFPDHSNVGDSAIWAGERAFLNHSGVKLRYVATMKNCDFRELEKQVPEGDIYLHGGGNFGTMWPAHQQHRIDVLQAFKGRRVIQLPQSIYFADLPSNGATKTAIEAHGQFTMIVRDEPSARFANTHYACPVIECPDLAFYLRALSRAPPSTNIVRLLRTDLERSSAQSAGVTAADAVDWLRDARVALRVTRLRSRLASLGTGRSPTRLVEYDRVAWHRIRRGCRLLSAGRVVITDRLHGHILCTLLGIPHVALDNSYGKLGNFIARWTACSADLHTANTLADAERVAAHMLAGVGRLIAGESRLERGNNRLASR